MCVGPRRQNKDMTSVLGVMELRWEHLSRGVV